MCSDVLFWLNQLTVTWASVRQPIKCNLLTSRLSPRGFLLVWRAQDHLSLVFSCWVQQRRELQVVLVDEWRGLGGHKPHSTLSCHPCSAAKLLCFVSRQLKRDLTSFFIWTSGCEFPCLMNVNCVWTDRFLRHPEGTGNSVTLLTGGKTSGLLKSHTCVEAENTAFQNSAYRLWLCSYEPEPQG